MAYVMPHSTTTQSAQNTVEVYFAVNKSNINSSFMDNAEQMKALTSMLGQGGVSKIHLMGYASPEGPYEFNRTLAAKRAEAVKRYLDDHNLSNQITITTDSSPANWTEVKHLLSESFIENWRDIVAIIDDDAISPANKNSTIKAKYPVAYDFMLCTWYPKLRLTYLSLDGASKQHAVEQVKSMMQSNPEQLSLEDIYMVAMTYERGSKEWDEIIIFAVEAYPQSPEARLNAANVAMANGDYAKAEKYLQGLPSTMPQALNSRGILAMAQGRYSEAMMFFQQAERDGVSEASYNIALLKELI